MAVLELKFSKAKIRWPRRETTKFSILMCAQQRSH